MKTPADFSTAQALAPAMPEIFILCMAFAVLMVSIFSKSRIVPFALTLLALLGTAVAVFSHFTGPTMFAFGVLFIDDAMARVLKISMCVSIAVSLIYSRPYLEARGLLSGEFLSLSLFAGLGMMVMISAHNMLALYVGLELLSLSLYAMVALQRDSAVATEAAMKYFVLGALASGLLLYGMSMIYGGTGSLAIPQIASAIEYSRANQTLVIFGLVFLVAGLGFKLGVVPFHMWIPDVYQGSATPVTLMIGAAPKLAGFAIVIRLLGDGLYGYIGDWKQMLMVLAVLSIGFGNLIAIAQKNLKRMLAYSTISHMGFMLLGFFAGNQNGYSAAMFYVVTYVLTTLLSFGMILLLSRQGFEADNLDDLKGLNQRSKWAAFMMLIVMVSLAGIPPAVGFFAKFAVLQSAWQSGYTYVVVFAVLMSVPAAFYYLNAIRLMYMDAPTEQNNAPINAPIEMQVVLAINAVSIVFLGLLPGPLLAICTQAIRGSIL
jgi:NADH-quinone oxidoreductase subunit N